MNPNECLIAAKCLYAADKNNSQIGLLSARYPDINMDDDYMIQSLLVKKKISAENKIIGWKIERRLGQVEKGCQEDQSQPLDGSWDAFEYFLDFFIFFLSFPGWPWGIIMRMFFLSRSYCYSNCRS